MECESRRADIHLQGFHVSLPNPYPLKQLESRPNHDHSFDNAPRELGKVRTSMHRPLVRAHILYGRWLGHFGPTKQIVKEHMVRGCFKNQSRPPLTTRTEMTPNILHTWFSGCYKDDQGVGGMKVLDNNQHTDATIATVPLF